MNPYKQGTRIEMIEMHDDPHPIERGTRGTVQSVFVWDEVHPIFKRVKEIQLDVKWDNGRTLGVILPHDEVKIIDGD